MLITCEIGDRISLEYQFVINTHFCSDLINLLSLDIIYPNTKLGWGGGGWFFLCALEKIDEDLMIRLCLHVEDKHTRNSDPNIYT